MPDATAPPNETSEQRTKRKNAERQKRYRARNKEKINAKRREVEGKRRAKERSVRRALAPKQPTEWQEHNASLFDTGEEVSRVHAEMIAEADVERERQAGQPYDPETIVDDLIRWAGAHLRVPSGLRQGKPYEIERWQEAYLRDAFGDGVKVGVLSTARKNGKTGLVAMLACAMLIGPLNKRNLKCICTSLTTTHVKELHAQIRQTLEMSLLADRVRIIDRAIRGDDDSEILFLATDAKRTGQSAGVDWVLCDELGLMDEGERGVWNGVRGATASRDGRILVISVRGRGPMMEEILERGDDPDVIVHDYSTPLGADIQDEKSWHLSNPALGTLKSLDDMRSSAAGAKRSRGDEQYFRLYQLNQAGMDAAESLVTVSEYQDISVETADELPPRVGQYVLGVDLGDTQSMTCVVAMWPWSGRVEYFGAFAGGGVTLGERGQADGVGDLYQQMAAEGNLLAFGADFRPPIVPLLKRAVSHWGYPWAIAADQYRAPEMRQCMRDEGYEGRCWLEIRMTGGEHCQDIQRCQQAVAAREVTLLRTRMAQRAFQHAELKFRNAVPSLVKVRKRARIDMASAFVVAVGVALRAKDGGRIGGTSGTVAPKQSVIL